MSELTVIDNAEVLIAKINTAHAEAQAYASKAVERALEAGDLLLLAKSQVAHGQWQAWLKQHCPAISVRTSQNYMRVARELPAEKRNVAHLTMREALKLVSPQEPVKEVDDDLLQSVYFLPKDGYVAYLNDVVGQWDYFITHSSKHEGYYNLVRWFTGFDNDEDLNENQKIPVNIFRRPLNEKGINLMLKSWKVLNETWILLDATQFNIDSIELFVDIEEENYRKKPGRNVKTTINVEPGNEVTP